MEQSALPDVGLENRSPSVAIGWNAFLFLLHLSAVYLIVKFFTPQLSGWVHGWLLPFLRMRSEAGDFQFAYSHVLVLSFVPGFLFGLMTANFRHRVAWFVWIVPVAVLGYKVATFPTPIFQSHLGLAFQHYFGGGFLIPEYHSYRELFQIAGTNPDMLRGLDQMQITAPAYAAVAYSLASWISMHFNLRVPGVGSLVVKHCPIDLDRPA